MEEDWLAPADADVAHSSARLKSEANLATAVADACARRGLDHSEARLIHHYSNAVYLLPRENAVARIATGPEAARRCLQTAEVVRRLAANGVAATEPLSGVEPVTHGDTTVSFWDYYPQQDSPGLNSAHLGHLLRHFHQAGPSSVTVGSWVPLASLHAALGEVECSNALTPHERQWLLDRIQQVRVRLSGLDWPLGEGLIHGDAWAGNLLWDAKANRAVLGDWDWVSHGPREVDLIPTWHAATRYGKGPAWSGAFVEEYGYDLAEWSGFKPLMAMRDLVQLTGPIRRAGIGVSYAQALRQRLNSLMSGDTETVWVAL
ncbi:MAG: phosphotransferase enzyme family protein [Micromonosporaceae bacterium]